MKFYYYVDKEGERQGPLPLEDLTSYDISPDTLVWCKGMENWQKAKNVHDFDGITHSQEQEVPEPVMQAMNSEDNDDIYDSNATEPTEDSPIEDDGEEESSSNLKYWIIGAVVVLLVIIGLVFTGNKTESTDTVDSTYVDSVATVDIEDEERTIKEFIANMYNNHLYEEYKFLEKHCSRHLLQKLQEDYDYDHTGVAYAIWDFRIGAQEGKPDGNGKSQIISVESSGDGWYTYEFYDGGWRGKNRVKCYIEDGEVIMDVLETVYSEVGEAYNDSETESYFYTADDVFKWLKGQHYYNSDSEVTLVITNIAISANGTVIARKPHVELVSSTEARIKGGDMVLYLNKEENTITDEESYDVYQSY